MSEIYASITLYGAQTKRRNTKRRKSKRRQYQKSRQLQNVDNTKCRIKTRHRIYMY
jgi:hypothetical protein